MKKRMKLAPKLYLSFGGVALITLLLGLGGYYGALTSETSVQEIGVVRLPSVESLLIIKSEAENIRGTLRTIGLPGLSAEMKEQQHRNLEAARKAYEAAWKVYEPLPQTAEEAEVWKQFVPAWNAWRAENDKAMKLARDIDALIQTYSKSAKNQEVGYLDALRTAQKKAAQATIEFKIQVQEWKNILIRGNDKTLFDKYMGAFEKSENNVQTLLGGVFDLMGQLGLDVKIAQGLIASHKELGLKYRDALKQFDLSDPEAGKKIDALVKGIDRPPTEGMKNMTKLLDVALQSGEGLYAGLQQQLFGPVTQTQRETIRLLNKLVKINAEVADHEINDANSQAAFIEFFTLIAMIVGVLLALVLGALITRSITRPIRHIIEGLSDGSTQVTSAAQQVSAGSQSLAEGAAEQAASIEETSSSLEEMSSMTKKNADNANEARTRMAEAGQIVSKVNKHMADMLKAIEEITQSSEETGKIIKTIDEIAFQTNLLALNAAVEAARAGEAGAGFAVVADEVRNLALRAADAAKNTANLIENTIKAVKNGNELTQTTQEAFKENMEIARKVGGLVDEISAASNEQAQGIEEINKAVAEMDKVVQQVAANAEESAAASEEMNAQAEQMQGFVGELVDMVGGSASEERPRSSTPAAKKPVRTGGRGDMKALAAPTRRNKAKSNPEDVIPMDEDLFKGF